MLSKLDHPSAIKLQETHQDEDHFHVVTELCNGGELCDHVMAQAKGKEKQYLEQEVANLLASCQKLLPTVTRSRWFTGTQKSQTC